MMLDLLAGGDHDREETRGRKPKAKPAGTVKMTIELTPEAVAIIARVQAASRAAKYPVDSRSEVICRALSGFDVKWTESIKKMVAELGTLMPRAIHEAVGRLP
jgi:hypothetical protein